MTTGWESHNHRCSSGINIMEVNNQLLIGFEFHSIKWNPFVAQLLGQEPTAIQVMGPKGESTAVVLLHVHSARTTPYDLSLYP